MPTKADFYNKRLNMHFQNKSHGYKNEILLKGAIFKNSPPFKFILLVVTLVL